MERGARQGRRVFAQVSLVERQRRLTVQLVKDVPGRARHAPVRPERIPAGRRPVPDPQAIPVKPDRDDRVRLQPVLGQHDGLAELGAVGGQAAGDDDPRRQHVTEAGDDVGPVDPQAVAEHEHADQIVGCQLTGDRAGRLAAGRWVRHRAAREAQARVLEPNGGDRESTVLNVGSADLACRRTADERDVREGVAKRREARGVSEHVARAERERHVRCPGHARRRLPTAGP